MFRIDLLSNQGRIEVEWNEVEWRLIGYRYCRVGMFH